MKILMFAAAMLVSVSSFARTPIAPPTQYSFQNVVVDGQETNYVASATLDLIENEIRVTVFEDNACPPGAFCAAVVGMRLIASFSAPIQSVDTSCGSTYWTGFEDKRPVDGLRVEVTLADHSSRICHDMEHKAAHVEASVTLPGTDQATVYQLYK